MKPPGRYAGGPQQDALVPPVLHASTFVVDSAQELAELLDGTRDGYSYARIDSPTADAFAEAVAALEDPANGAAKGQAFASGMAAISTTLLGLLTPGDHVVAPASCYGGTYALLRGTLARFGIETTFADQTDARAVAAAMTDRTRVVWAESFANPTMLMPDIPALSKVAGPAGALLAVDSTFASPAMLRPLEWGADLVLHSATKYLGGHSDATGGVAVAPQLCWHVSARPASNLDPFSRRTRRTCCTAGWRRWTYGSPGNAPPHRRWRQRSSITLRWFGSITPAWPDTRRTRWRSACAARAATVRC